MEENFSMEWNMEENFSMEWNMEWKIFGMEWNGMEENCQYEIWNNRLPFHSIPCPDHGGTRTSTQSSVAAWWTRVAAPEVIFIKTQLTILRRQKEFVYSKGQQLLALQDQVPKKKMLFWF